MTPIQANSATLSLEDDEARQLVAGYLAANIFTQFKLKQKLVTKDPAILAMKILEQQDGKTGYQRALKQILKQHKWTSSIEFLTKGAVMFTIYFVYNVLWCFAAWHLFFKK
jgi:hypothetical protein